MNDRLELRYTLGREHGAQRLAPHSMNVVVNGRENIRGIAKSAREIPVLVSAAGAVVESVVKIWIINMQF
jgi:hypothetical protein